MTWQVICIQDLELVAAGLEPGTMVALNNNNRWIGRISHQGMGSNFNLVVNICDLIQIALVIVYLRINAVCIHEKGWVGGRAIRSKYKQRMRDNHMDENEFWTCHMGKHLHAIQVQCGAVTIPLPINLLEIEQSQIFQMA